MAIYEFCSDPAFGEYLVRTTLPASESGIDGSLRTLLRCCPNREDDLLGVSTVDGVAYLDFNPAYVNSDEWANVTTSGGQMSFIAPLLETAFQFDEVDAVALRFGSALWWPTESDHYEPYGRDSAFRMIVGLPGRHRGIAEVARRLADSLSREKGDWRPHVRAVGIAPDSVVLQTDLAAKESELARRAVAAATASLESLSECELDVRVADSRGHEFERLRAFRDCL